MSIGELLTPILTSLIEKLLETFKGNDEDTINWLTNVLLVDEENRTKLAIAVERIKAEQALAKIW